MHIHVNSHTTFGTLSFWFILFRSSFPTLHISLGVYKKLYDLFEEECHKLDVFILEHKAKAVDESDTSEHPTNFGNQIKAEAMRKTQLAADLQKSRLQLEDLEDELPLDLLDFSNDHPTNNSAIKVKQLRDNIADMVCIIVYAFSYNLFCALSFFPIFSYYNWFYFLSTHPPF